MFLLINFQSTSILKNLMIFQSKHDMPHPIIKHSSHHPDSGHNNSHQDQVRRFGFVGKF